jgi:hypothetical protein
MLGEDPLDLSPKLGRPMHHGGLRDADAGSLAVGFQGTLKTSGRDMSRLELTGAIAARDGRKRAAAGLLIEPGIGYRLAAD